MKFKKGDYAKVVDSPGDNMPLGMNVRIKHCYIDGLFEFVELYPDENLIMCDGWLSSRFEPSETTLIFEILKAYE